MYFVALVSGGKDSIYSIMECIRNGHELVACCHLSPRIPPLKKDSENEEEEEEEEEESYMYQTAGSECVSIMVEQCIGVPLVLREIVGKSRDTSLVYDHVDHNLDESTKERGDQSLAVEDEVEDLYHLLREAKQKYPSVQAVCSGAILSTYQRTRIESVCSRLNLIPLGYLWRIGPQRGLLRCMIEDDIEAVLVKVASPPGLSGKHLNKTLRELHESGLFDRLKEKFEFHICGEGGEYETLVLDCPIFKKRLVFDSVEVLEGDDGVGVLKVGTCSAEGKILAQTNTNWKKRGLLHQRIIDFEQKDCLKDNNVNRILSEECQLKLIGKTKPRELPSFLHLPHLKILSGGLAHISGLVSQRILSYSDLQSVSPSLPDSVIEAELAVLEAKSIFITLQHALSAINWNAGCYGTGTSATANDVVFVHLYLSDISHFSKINAHYSSFFGTISPPSRSCVAVGKHMLREARRVMLDCWIQRGSGAYLRLKPDTDDQISKPNSFEDEFVHHAKMNFNNKLRSTLHVQSMSHWAPVCVGPYSQANTLRSGLILLAGQIGLIPSTMTLAEGGWEKQLRQSWKNAASVLDALGATLEQSLGALVYVSSNVVQSDDISVNEVWEKVDKISRLEINHNGSVSSGFVDEISDAGNDEIYEVDTVNEQSIIPIDQDSLSTSFIPILIVSIPQIPAGSLAEVELICCSNQVASSLGVTTSLAQAIAALPYSSAEDNQTRIGWNLGHDGLKSEEIPHRKLQPHFSFCSSFEIDSFVRYAGKGCLATAYVSASLPQCSNEDISTPRIINIEEVIEDMVDSAILCLNDKAELDKSVILHIRLFHVSAASEDSLKLHSAMQSALSLGFKLYHHKNKAFKENRKTTCPAFTIVPVQAMCMPMLSLEINKLTLFAMQVVAVDLLHMETEMWINSER